jgi:hypothetical protein
MNFVEHFCDESNGSGVLSYEGPDVTERGNFLCVQSAQQPLHVYRRVETDEQVHPAVEQVVHNGVTYKLAWIDDDQW